VFGGGSSKYVDGDILHLWLWLFDRWIRREYISLTGEDRFGYKISNPAGIFTAELTALL
jgi:hypothetical protein